jgi:hypothetical protein
MKRERDRKGNKIDAIRGIKRKYCINEDRRKEIRKENVWSAEG